MFIVTVKLPNNPKHNPRKKITGPCPLGIGDNCTDNTGAHHSILAVGDSDLTILKAKYHITRIEVA